HSPNVRDLWYWYLTAPRLLHQAPGDWVMQTTCQVAYPDRPAIGGILLWQDKWNYLRLDWGERGQNSVVLQGCVNNREVVIGCGQLCTATINLRLERRGSQVRALCGDTHGGWYLVGQVDLPPSDPVQVGLFAASNIDRYIYPGHFPAGTAIRFRNFQQWRPQSGCDRPCPCASRTQPRIVPGGLSIASMPGTVARMPTAISVAASNEATSS
ncbi:MAG: hypothetical protein KDE31_14070, partial [Caldilineaceae bacterium]|nr:hypothetical protein [Caldilineaceae bacterium]